MNDVMVGAWLTVGSIGAMWLGFWLAKKTPNRFSDFDVPDTVTAIVATVLCIAGVVGLLAALTGFLNT